MAFTGMRRGEALALRRCDFNPAAKTLRIERALEYTKKHGLMVKAPRSERGKRTIILDDTLAALLLRMRHVVAKKTGHDPAVLLKVNAKRTQKREESAAETIVLLTKGLSIGPT